MPGDKLQAAIRKAQGCIANADDPATPPEAAASYRAQAEAIMFKYKIDSLVAPDASVTNLITFAQLPIYSLDSEFSMHYRTLAYSIVSHADCHGIMLPAVKNEETGTYFRSMEIIGLESDVANAEMLLVSAMMTFGKKLEPVYEPSESAASNAYRMRAAGMEGHRIAQAIYGRNEKPLRVKVRNLAKEEMIRRGEDPEGLFGRGVNVKAFREDYANSFVHTLYSRLSVLRSERGETSYGLVLANAKERVQEYLYERHPSLRPSKEPMKFEPLQECPNCKKAKGGYCRAHRPRYARTSVRQYSAAGARRGADAARSVDLGARGTGRVNPGSGRREIG